MYPKDINDWPCVKVYGTDFRRCLLNAANAITNYELWDWLKNYNPEEGKGFMFSSDQNINLIGNALDSDGHSGATFAYTMRCMETIAKDGFESFSSKFEKN